LENFSADKNTPRKSTAALDEKCSQWKLVKVFGHAPFGETGEILGGKLSWQKESRKCTRREGTRFIDGISDRMGGK